MIDSAQDDRVTRTQVLLHCQPLIDWNRLGFPLVCPGSLQRCLSKLRTKSIRIDRFVSYALERFLGSDFLELGLGLNGKLGSDVVLGKLRLGR